MAGALAWINHYNKNRKKKGKSEMTNAEKAALTACATGIGCLLGSELAGQAEEYVSIKRAEYRAEIAQLEEDIHHIEKSISDADSQLAWMDSQSKELTTHAENVKNLPVGKEYMASELKKAAKKRETDIDFVEKNLLAAKADTQFLQTVATDQEQKKKLEEDLQALEERLSATRTVRDNILAANASVEYL